MQLYSTRYNPAHCPFSSFSDAQSVSNLSCTFHVFHLVLAKACLLLLKTVSHGAPGVQENVVADGDTVVAEDTNPDTAESNRRFKGTFQLSRVPATSFRSYNIEVSVSLDYILAL